ncbi:MAG: YbbR-like domain-containing protein [Fimbriimonadaceae bacterium]
MKREDVLLLIASFVIAVALWFQVQPMFEPGHEREFFVSLQMENKPENLFINTPTDNVTVVASGTIADLDKLDTSKVIAYIELKSAKSGDSSLPIQIRAPADSNLQFRAKTPTIRITGEQIIRDNRKVKVITTGTPANGLILTGTVANPDSVELFGPKSNIQKVSILQVTVDLEKLRPGQTYAALVAILDDEGNPVPATFTNPARITVAASYTTSIATREVPLIVDWTGQVASGYMIDEISVAPDHVEISGKSEDVSSITILKTEKIDISGIKANKEVTVKLVSPPGINPKIRSVQVFLKVKRK